MTDPKEEVKQEQVSQPTEPVSPEAGKQPTTPAPEPSLDPKVATLINQKVAEELAKATEASKREIQSVKDKAKREVELAQKRAQLAEGTLGATQTYLKGLDPETAKEFELAQLRAEKQGRMSLEQEEQLRSQREAYAKSLQDSLYAHLKELEIDPEDKRIDWALDAPDYLTGRGRFDASVTKVLKERAKTSEADLEKRITEKIKKDLGVTEDVNSVDTSISGGVSKSGIPTNMAKFQQWADSISLEEYARLKPEIDKMLAEGKIK